MNKMLNLFNLKKAGLEKVIGALGVEVLEIVWNKTRVSGKDVWDELKKKREIALTTVLTIIDRLLKRNFLKRERVDGIYLYSSSFGREDFDKQVAREVISGLFSISRDSTVSTFIDLLAEIKPDDLAKIKAIVNSKTSIKSENRNKKRRLIYD